MIGNNRWWAKLYFVHHQVVCFTVCPPPGMVEATRMVGNQEVGKEVARRVEGAIKVNLLSAILIINLILFINIPIINILIINIPIINILIIIIITASCCHRHRQFW